MGTDVFAEVEALGVVPVVEIKDVAANYRRLPHVSLSVVPGSRRAATLPRAAGRRSPSELARS
jgi:hypothetical protein